MANMDWNKVQNSWNDWINSDTPITVGNTTYTPLGNGKYSVYNPKSLLLKEPKTYDTTGWGGSQLYNNSLAKTAWEYGIEPSVGTPYMTYDTPQSGSYANSTYRPYTSGSNNSYSNLKWERTGATRTPAAPSSQQASQTPSNINNNASQNNSGATSQTWTPSDIRVDFNGNTYTLGTTPNGLYQFYDASGNPTGVYADGNHNITWNGQVVGTWDDNARITWSDPNAGVTQAYSVNSTIGNNNNNTQNNNQSPPPPPQQPPSNNNYNNYNNSNNNSGSGVPPLISPGWTANPGNSSMGRNTNMTTPIQPDNPRYPSEDPGGQTEWRKMSVGDFINTTQQGVGNLSQNPYYQNTQNMVDATADIGAHYLDNLNNMIYGGDKFDPVAYRMATQDQINRGAQKIANDTLGQLAQRGQINSTIGEDVLGGNVNKYLADSLQNLEKDIQDRVQAERGASLQSMAQAGALASQFSNNAITGYQNLTNAWNNEYTNRLNNIHSLIQMYNTLQNDAAMRNMTIYDYLTKYIDTTEGA